ncbi:hypothetical protein SAY87_017014 [Trapa incisa]|uniref:Uncharacterized protein n=1 Tax=Trapa incisa TaxID=236973 RepID=A0AAN7LDD3_9MYRT|nr:hypothetical protein SAY87_017014 [Trapa incisa]
MDSCASQNPLGDKETSSSNPPDEGGGEEGGGGEPSVVVPEVFPLQKPAEEGPGRGLESDLGPCSDEVALGGAGCPQIKAAGKEMIRKKRGRAPRSSTEKEQSDMNRLRKREKKDEEDVCFICFDGGELVICDRRSCPKAYHPACVKRSLSFFQSKAKWKCGWHICTNCQKAAHYMCYMCPHSLCKLCSRNADFICIRETKGLCASCRGTIMLIENVKEGNKEMVQVDFDDKGCWEYLFKVYWTDLKTRLSLTVDEVTRAKSVRKDRKINSRRSIGRLSNGHAKLDSRILGIQQSSYSCKNAGWASEELLEFVRYVKGGDASALSRYEVQALLLEYVDRNNLHDPKQKWQISCDMKLGKLFRKASIDHFEMLRLLDSHFVVKEDIQGTSFDAVGMQIDIDLNKAEQPVLGNNKLETCRTVDEDSHIYQDDYKMMDSQKISSIYLQRRMIENLVDDDEQFHRKVLGSIVRIRISGEDQKCDMHKLVQVVGASKGTEPSKIGDKYSNVKLEVQNFDRKEVISIDEISDSNFCEEECRQFNQSIHCGEVKWFRKDELLQKTPSIKAEKVNDRSSYQLPVMVDKTMNDRGGETSGISNQNLGKIHADAVSSVTREPLSGAGPEISPSPLSTGTEQSVNDDEAYKMWHYEDSNRKILGPVTMIQMIKWKRMGKFPCDQRVWRINEKQEDSILLTDALEGNFLKESPTLHSEEGRHISEDRDSSIDGVSSISVDTNNNNASDLGSHSLCHTIKTEREDIEKACGYFQGQFSNPSGTFSVPIGRSQGFDTVKGISRHQQVGVALTPDDPTVKEYDGDGYVKEYDGDGYSSTQSSGQNWKAPSPVVESSNNNIRAGSFVDSLLSTPHLGNGKEIVCSAVAGSVLKSDLENFKYPNASIKESHQSWSTGSSSVDGTINRVITSECVSASNNAIEMPGIDGSTLTLGSAQLIPPSTVPTSFSWQAKLFEPIEFSPLPEESVSDLLAELEESQPLNTSFPSPSPKCSDGSRGCITDNCFSQEADLFLAPQLETVDSFNASHNFPILPVPTAANELRDSCYFSLPHNMQGLMIQQENPSSTSYGYRNGYPEQGQVSWFCPAERNAEIWGKQQQFQHQHQPHVGQYYGGNSNFSTRDHFGALNMDFDQGKPM